MPVLSISKKLFLTALATAAILTPHTAQARNLELESSLRSLGDLSDFYHALVYTGVANELREGQAYTVLAPTNAAFAVLNRENYPCFYQPQCHDLAAAFVRAHIIEGHYPEKWMVREVHLQTEGKQWVVAQEPFVNQYTVNNRNVLSEADAGNNVIYRLDGFVIPDNNLAVFRTVSYTSPANTIVTKTTTTYVAPEEDTEVNSEPVILPGVNADTATVQKTTVTHVYTPNSAWQ